MSEKRTQTVHLKDEAKVEGRALYETYENGLRRLCHNIGIRLPVSVVEAYILMPDGDIQIILKSLEP